MAAPAAARPADARPGPVKKRSDRPFLSPVGDGSALLAVLPVVPGGQPGTFVVQESYVYTLRGSSWAGPARLPAPGASSVAGLAGASRWWTTGGSSVLVTDDAGDHWETVGQSPNGWLFEHLAVVDPDHAWAVLFDQTTCAAGMPCLTSLARTADGGRHWALVRPPI